MAVKLVIDHVRGARRGQRQIVEDLERVSFGRHPNNVVTFDATTDIDASSQHAELVSEAVAESVARGQELADLGLRYVLRDIGSSNGTWIGGQRVEKQVLILEEAIEVEFGSGGPIVRLWLGTQSPPAAFPTRRGWRKRLPW